MLAASHAPSRRAKVVPFLLRLFQEVVEQDQAWRGDDIKVLAAALQHAEASGMQTSMLKETLGEMGMGVAALKAVRDMTVKHVAVVRYVGGGMLMEWWCLGG